MAFLLTTEPWIPCRTPDGKERVLGLTDVLTQSHTLASVHDPSPPVTLALHRLLLAVLHRVLGPPDLDTWKSIYAHRAFDADALRSYLQAHEQQLDLVHPERPFYQVRGLTMLYEADGVGRLLFERSNYGAAVNVFQHRPMSETSQDGLSLAEAARSLLALQGFAPGGLVKKKDEPGSATAAPLNRGAFVLIHGRNLFETLMLNMLVYSPENGQPVPGRAGEDVPSWEAPALSRPLGAKEPARRPRGWIDWLTWQSRRLELIVNDETGLVTGVVYCVGQGMSDDALTDPMLPYRVDKTRGLVAIDLSEDRAAWRDCHALVRTADADGARPPAAVTQLGSFALRSVLADYGQLVLDVLGMRGDRAEIRLTRHERIALPAAILADPERVAAIGTATRAAEDVGLRLTYALRDAVRSALAPGGRDPDPEDVRRVTESLGAERSYWAALGAPFESFLDQLGRGPVDAAVEGFASRLRRTARERLRHATDALGVGAGKFKGAALAERRLHRFLNELFPPAATAAERGPT